MRKFCLWKWVMVVMSLMLFSLMDIKQGLCDTGVKVVQGSVNEMLDVTTPSTLPMEKLRADWLTWNKYVSIVTFPVVRGERYTLYIHYPPDGKSRGTTIQGANPFKYPRKSKLPFSITSEAYTAPSPRADCQLISRRYNLTISPQSSGSYLYVMLSSDRPMVKFKVMLKHPADADAVVKAASYYPDCRGWKHRFFWGDVIGEFKVWQDPNEKDVAQAQVFEASTIRPSSGGQQGASIENFSGEFEVIGAKGVPYIKLVLNQTGNKISGRAYYDKGSAKVIGTKSSGKLKLKFIYDDVKVLEKWLPPKVARQVVGISSPFEFNIVPGANRFEGLMQPFYVWWDTNMNVTKKADGGSPSARAQNKPNRQVLRRAEQHAAMRNPSSLYLEAEDETAYNVYTPTNSNEWAWRSRELANLPHYSGKGYWYLSRGGDWLSYILDIPESGAYRLWIRDLNDKKHPYGQRTVDVYIDCKKIASVPETQNSGPDNWGWHVAAQVNLTNGKHVMIIRKQATTSAAAVIDAFYFTTGSESPVEYR